MNIFLGGGKTKKTTEIRKIRARKARRLKPVTMMFSLTLILCISLTMLAASGICKAPEEPNKIYDPEVPLAADGLPQVRDRDPTVPVDDRYMPKDFIPSESVKISGYSSSVLHT